MNGSRSEARWLPVEPLLPEQLPVRHALDRLPEIELLRCVLLQALVDASGRAGNVRGSERQVYHVDALRWLHSDDETSITSFVTVCRVLGLCPDAVRQAVVRSAA